MGWGLQAGVEVLRARSRPRGRCRSHEGHLVVDGRCSPLLSPDEAVQPVQKFSSPCYLVHGQVRGASGRLPRGNRACRVSLEKVLGALHVGLKRIQHFRPVGGGVEQSGHGLCHSDGARAGGLIADGPLGLAPGVQQRAHQVDAGGHASGILADVGGDELLVDVGV